MLVDRSMPRYVALFMLLCYRLYSCWFKVNVAMKQRSALTAKLLPTTHSVLEQMNRSRDVIISLLPVCRSDNISRALRDPAALRTCQETNLDRCCNDRNEFCCHYDCFGKSSKLRMRKAYPQRDRENQTRSATPSRLRHDDVMVAIALTFSWTDFSSKPQMFLIFSFPNLEDR